MGTRLVLQIQNVRRWSLERHVLLQGIPESIYFISFHAAYIYAEHIVWDCIDWIAGKIRQAFLACLCDLCELRVGVLTRLGGVARGGWGLTGVGGRCLWLWRWW